MKTYQWLIIGALLYLPIATWLATLVGKAIARRDAELDP